MEQSKAPQHKRILKKVKKGDNEEDTMAELEDYHEGSDEDNILK